MGATCSVMNDLPGGPVVWCKYVPFMGEIDLVSTWMGGNNMAGKFVQTRSTFTGEGHPEMIVGNFQGHTAIVKYTQQQPIFPILIEIDGFNTWQEAKSFFDREVGNQLSDHGLNECDPGNEYKSMKGGLSLPRSFFGMQLYIGQVSGKNWVVKLIPGHTPVNNGATADSNRGYSMAWDVRWGDNY
ncbi:hypothetical protein LTR64_002186 [Lithohypha guttulata]|uniref:Uncharacterized protein n=1 Tax=Lithohypha guttulata TaxID=1690604 RepID=A0AAN7STK4_9EURO|nr:hypothetical protein LTR51_001590 [Lithohypha guttulata]KAK5081005.1 hypothetical protein LTR05_008322 [Lithohypha guttulata]